MTTTTTSDALTLGSPDTDPVGTQRVNGLHVQFGADASSEMVVSWHTRQPVARAKVQVGRRPGEYERTLLAQPVSYTDAKSGQTVYAYHAHIAGLRPSTKYFYAAGHDGAEAEYGSFETGPAGRQRFTFTSFGDQGTPTVDATNPNMGSPAAADTTAGVESLRPLFHLFNGDLSYANLANDRVRTWNDFWANNSRSARYRPWMPAPGNHENELGNGPIGYAAYQTYFALPAQLGQTPTTRGLWYAFTAGSVRVIVLANDDVCYQDAGNSYVRGYSGGAQRTWLEAELKASRASRVHRLDRRLHASGGHFYGRRRERRRSWPSPGMGAVVRRVRRRSGRLRPRASL